MYTFEIEIPSKIVKEGGSSELATLIKILKVSMGSGLISLPYVFSIVGVLGGTGLLIIIAIINFSSWKSMI
jgi:amino acid permease